VAIGFGSDHLADFPDISNTRGGHVAVCPLRPWTDSYILESGQAGGLM